MWDKVNITRLDSPIALAGYLQSIPKHYYANYEEDWGGCSIEDSIRILHSGDMTYVDRAKSIMDKIEQADILTVGVKIIAADIVGFSPLVPNVLAGLPTCMLNRQISEIEASNTPLSIYIDTTVSSGVSVEHLISRGVATLAFAMAMNTVRPIDLYTVSTCQGDVDRNCAFGVCTRIETRPLDLPRASWMLVDPGMARRIMHTSAQFNRDGKVGNAPFSFSNNPTDDSYENKMREVLNMEPQDVFIRGGWLFDKLMHTDPVAWVNQMIKKHTEKDETNA